MHDEVVRGANHLEDADSLAARIALPPHLATKPALAELYGQVAWSARAVYSNALGWFDGRADRLYPPEGFARREIELMGGPGAVLSEARTAREAGDPRWSAHLLGKLRDSGLADAAALAPELAASYDALGHAVTNANGRAYLLESAHELLNGPPDPISVALDEAFVDAIPVALTFEVLPSLLKTGPSMAVHESVVFHFTDTGEHFVLTVRQGVAEVVTGDPLPDTPEPVSVVTTDAHTWRRVALGLMDQIEAVIQGKLAATDLVALAVFMERFDDAF